MNTPSVQYSFGDPSGNLGATIDRWDDDDASKRYQAQTWADGQPTALGYFHTFEAAVAWLKIMFVDDFVQLHDQYDPSEVDVVGLAPGRNGDDRPWEWCPVNRDYADYWWEGSDHEDPATRPVKIHFFPDHEPV